MFNSVSIALLAATTVAVMSSIVAFGFAYFRFPGRRLLFGLVLATMMLPGCGDDDPDLPHLERDRAARHLGAAVGA